MMRLRLMAFLAVAGVSAAAQAEYRPEPWNLEARRQFAGRRFGIFVHWGLYANYAQGEWYLQKGKLDERAYSRMMYGFHPSKFDAREWVRVFKDSGAKYVTVTSRHHDGFSLWPTAADDGYNIANTPFGRDVLGELSAACAEAGLQLNFYYSLMDRHRRDYPAGADAREVLGDQRGDYPAYKRFMLAQLGELLERYRPGVIWFDGEWDHAHYTNGTWQAGLDWGFDEIYDFVHSKRALVANNNHQPIREREDIQLFERDLPGENASGFSPDAVVSRERPLEQCDVVQRGVWGYRIGESDFRTPEEVCAMICRSAAKDSNLLLNVGPDGSGQLPEEAVKVLEAVGRWLRRNGEAIYDTRGAGLETGADGVERAYTRRGDTLFTIILRPGAYPSVERLATK